MTAEPRLDLIARASSRFFLAASAIVVVVTLIGMAFSELDWRACFENNASKPFGLPGVPPFGPKPFVEKVFLALHGLAASPIETAVSAATALPIFLTIALSRNPLLHLLAFLLLFIPVAVLYEVVDNMHDCDRKGCVGCFGVALVVITMQMPASATLCFITMAERLLAGIDRLTGRRCPQRQETNDK